MSTILLLALAAQLVVFGAGFALLWRRLHRTENELLELRRVVEAVELAMERERAAARKSRAKAEPAMAVGAKMRGPSAPPAPERAERAWPAPVARLVPDTPPLIVVDEPEAPHWFNPRLQFISAAAALALLPLLGLLVGFGFETIAPAGLIIAGTLALAGIRDDRSDAAWVGAVGGLLWSLIGLGTNAAMFAPIAFSSAATFAGGAGLAHLTLRESQRGAVLAGGMGVSLLWLGASIGMIGAAGAGLAAMVTAAALLGARNLRSEPLLYSAFATAGVGLFVLSAQESAAIWFTPAAALAGILFLAIAFVRVPQLGPRGGAVAGTGAAASMFAVGALYVSQHGLANPWAASAGFVALAATFAGFITLAAQRRGGDVQRLKLTLWVLGFTGFASIASAIFIVAPTPLCAALMAALALGFTLLDLRFRTLAWRVFTVASLTFAAMAEWTSAQSFLTTLPIWPRWAIILVAFAAPTALAAAAAHIARPGAKLAADMFETFAIIGAIATGIMTLRFAFSPAEFALLPLGFLEAGAQITLMLGASLALAATQRRELAGLALILALALGAVASAFWLTDTWIERPYAALAPYGFALMAGLLWAHWVFWRNRAANVRTRVTFAAAALATAAFLTLLIVNGAEKPALDALTLGLCGALFALALGASFAPQIVNPRRPRYLRRRF
jgi:hypothetical protein